MQIFCRYPGLISALFIWHLVAEGLAQSPERLSQDFVVGKPVPPNIVDFISYFSVYTEPVRSEGFGQKSRSRLRTLQQRLKTKETDGEKAKIYLAIGELHYSRFKAGYRRRVEAFAQKQLSWQQRGRIEDPPVFLIGREKNEIEKAINAYRHIIFDLTEKNTSPQIFYKLAELLAISDPKSSQIYLKRILKKYPNSDYVAQARLLLAETMIASKQIKPAQKALRKAILSEKREVRVYTRYRMAWVSQLLAKEESQGSPRLQAASLQQFAKAIKDLKLSSSSPAKTYLENEMLKDLVMISADLGAKRQAKLLFDDVGEPKRYYDMLQRLGWQLALKGKYKGAIDAYGEIVNHNSVRRENPFVFSRLLELQEKTQRFDAIPRTFAAMEKTFLLRSAWIQAFKRDKGLIKTTQTTFARDLRRYHSLYLKLTKTGSDKKYVTYAISLANLYLKHFKTNRDAMRVRHQLAKLQLNNKLLASAAENFFIISQKLPPKSQQRLTSLQRAVNAMNEFMAKRQKSEAQQKLPLGKAETKQIEYIDRYLKEFPGNEFALDQLFISGQTYHRFAHFDQSVNRFMKIIKTAPTAKQTKASIKILIDHYALQKNYQGGLDFSRRVFKTAALHGPKLANYVADAIQMNTFALAASLERQKKIPTATNLLLAFQKSFPRHDQAHEALYRAFLMHQKNPSTKFLIPIGNRFLSAYSRSEHYPKVLYTMIKVMEEVVNLDKASKYALLFFKKYNAQPQAAETLFAAAQHFRALQRIDIAAGLFAKYAKLYPKNVHAGASLIAAGELYYNLDLRDAALRAFRNYTQGSYVKTGEDLLYARMHVAVLDGSVAAWQQKSLKPILAAVAQAPGQQKVKAARFIGRYLIGQLKQRSQLELQSEFDSSADLRPAIQQKNAALATAVKLHDDIVGVAPPGQSMYAHQLMGELYADFSQKLFRVLKAGSSKDKTYLENAAFSAKEKSQAYYSSALKLLLGSHVSAYNQLVSMRLGDIYPSKIKAVQEDHILPYYSEHNIQ